MESSQNYFSCFFQVESLRESYPGTYIHRTLSLSIETSTKTVIEQLQSDTWPDMTAPNDTKVLAKS